VSGAAAGYAQAAARRTSLKILCTLRLIADMGLLDRLCLLISPLEVLMHDLSLFLLLPAPAISTFCD
jgi:hypothetical protein